MVNNTTHQMAVRYTPELLRTATRRFWQRYIAWHGVLAMGLCWLALAVLLLEGDRSWMVGALAIVGVLGLGMATALYVVFLRRSLWKFHRMANPTVLFEFTEEGLRSESDLGASKLAWKGVEKIWRFPEVWLLFVGRTAYFTLPVDAMDETTRAFIAAQVEKSGGEVR